MLQGESSAKGPWNTNRPADFILIRTLLSKIGNSSPSIFIAAQNSAISRPTPIGRRLLVIVIRYGGKVRGSSRIDFNQIPAFFLYIAAAAAHLFYHGSREKKIHFSRTRPSVKGPPGPPAKFCRSPRPYAPPRGTSPQTGWAQCKCPGPSSPRYHWANRSVSACLAWAYPVTGSCVKNTVSTEPTRFT